MVTSTKPFRADADTIHEQLRSSQLSVRFRVVWIPVTRNVSSAWFRSGNIHGPGVHPGQ